MENHKEFIAFGKEHAASYDTQWAKLAPLNEALHVLMRMILSDLPADARILCLGAGTGSELIALAQAFPEWRFTAVDPSGPMLDVCRARAEESGIAARCAFHEGYLPSLPASPAFDAATCLLVSHFLLRQEERRELFAQIASRLVPGGLLLHSALASDAATDDYRILLAVWMRMMRYTGIPEANVQKIPEIFARNVAMLPPAAVESDIAASGFAAPVLFYQTLFIHAWHTQRGPGLAQGLA